MKKLLFFDIDGTLAIPGQPPSGAVVQALQAARANGHKLIVSTGRTLETVPDFITEIGFDGGIYSAGGLVIAEGQRIAERTMRDDMVRMVISAMQAEGLSFTLECSGGNYRSGFDSAWLTQRDMSGAGSELRRIMTDWMTNSLDQYQGEPIYKISFLAQEQREVHKLRQRLCDGVKVVSFGNMISGFPFIAGEVSDPNVNKGLALREVCAYYGTLPEQSIAFGDSMNDAEMLREAGTGIAMGNAEDCVKNWPTRYAKAAQRMASSTRWTGLACLCGCLGRWFRQVSLL